MNKDRFSRRALLAGIGASAAMLPLLHSEPAVGAAPAAFPKRLITVTWGNGICPPDFYPAGADLTIGTTLAALAPFKAKMLMPIGLDQTVVLDAVGNRQYDGHFTYPSLLTGTAEQKSEGTTGMGPSVDQFISDAITKSGVSLAAPLLNIGVRTNNGGGNPTSWRASGQKNTPEADPYHLFDRLFASAAVPLAQLDTIRIRRQSILDFLGKDLEAFSTKLGTDDKTKIQAHLASIRDLETQLQQGMVMAGASCVKPTLPAQTANPDTPTLMKMMFDLGAVAIKCDLTRVITYDLYDDGGADGNNFPWIGVSDDYHKIAHQGSAGYPAKMKIDAWIFSQIANLVTQLDATMEAGGTALDHSVIMTANDMDEGASHYVGKCPFLLIGSCGGYFKSGVQRYTKTPHNKLLATLCNAMDVPVTSYGAPGYEGTLPELLA
jgi:Protein of unknown function (DUF1552)